MILVNLPHDKMGTLHAKLQTVYFCLCLHILFSQQHHCVVLMCTKLHICMGSTVTEFWGQIGIQCENNSCFT